VGTHVVRVWLPDRPGALGAVASRIGAVRGDLVGIDILERGGGRAIDELVVALPDDGLVSLLVHEMSEVDGVDVEDVRPVRDAVHDPRLDALETAAVLVEQSSAGALLDALVSHAASDFESGWAALVGDDPLPERAVGPVPPAAWLRAFVAGSRAMDGRRFTTVDGGATGTSRRPAEDEGPHDVAWAELREAGVVLVLGRDRAWRTRERRQLAAVARIADHRWTELSLRGARQFHPSAAG
jgi:hypothetical protein